MISITRGQDKNVILKLRGAVSGDPVDLTGSTEVKVSFPLETPAGTYLQKKLSLSQVSIGSDPKLGVMTMALSDAETVLLKVGDEQEIQVKVTKGSDDKIYTGAVLSVKERTDLAS